LLQSYRQSLSIREIGVTGLYRAPVLRAPVGGSDGVRKGPWNTSERTSAATEMCYTMRHEIAERSVFRVTNYNRP